MPALVGLAGLTRSGPAGRQPRTRTGTAEFRAVAGVVSSANVAPDEEQEIAWAAVPANAPVVASDGVEIGHVLDVAALPQEDIFHGIVFHHRALGRTYLAPAADVARITDRAVYLSVDSQSAEAFEEFHELTVRRLGVRGILHWKHLGWKDSSE
jgi:hypothetical protein